MNSIDKNFQLVLLPFRHVEQKLAKFYTPAAECWEKVWRDLFLSSGFNKPLFLDNLIRQDEAACIFNGDRCAAMILFRLVDFGLMDFRRDSYFTEWHSGNLDKLLRHGSKVFVTSYLTVHPEFRNFSPEVKFKSVLLDIMVKRFLQTSADVISGITRCDRGINDEVYRLGAETVSANEDYMEGRFKVDLIAIPKGKAIESPEVHVRALSDRLWKTRLDHQTQTEPSAKAA